MPVYERSFVHFEHKAGSVSCGARRWKVGETTTDPAKVTCPKCPECPPETVEAEAERERHAKVTARMIANQAWPGGRPPLG